MLLIQGATKIAQLNAETVEINAKIEQVGENVKSVGAKVDEIKSAGGAGTEHIHPQSDITKILLLKLISKGMEDLKKAFDSEIAAFAEQLEVIEGMLMFYISLGKEVLSQNTALMDTVYPQRERNGKNIKVYH